MDLFARLRGRFDRRRRDELCERFDLDPTNKGRTYSKGNRQKVAIVAALASDVELLIGKTQIPSRINAARRTDGRG